MLKQEDKIFKNLYGFDDWKLKGALKRGIWSNTKDLIKLGSDKIVDEIKKSQLRGRGGAGFPAFKKWQFVKSYKGPRLMCINADEGEPGTFKDRYYLNKDPHRFLEGTLIAAKLVEAEKCYLYIRDEYYGLIKLIERCIKELVSAKIIPSDFLINSIIVSNLFFFSNFSSFVSEYFSFKLISKTEKFIFELPRSIRL